MRRLPAKTVSAVEQSILDRQPSEIEQQLASERQAYAAYEAEQQRMERQKAQQQARSQAIQTGMQCAVRWGKVLGRPRQAESADRFVAKPSSQRAIAALLAELSERLGMLWIEVWLGVLLGDFELEQRGEFYHSPIWVRRL